MTDQYLQYLKDIHTIHLSNCSQLTNQCLQYLAVDFSALLSGKLKGAYKIYLLIVTK